MRFVISQIRVPGTTFARDQLSSAFFLEVPSMANLFIGSQNEQTASSTQRNNTDISHTVLENSLTDKAHNNHRRRIDERRHRQTTDRQRHFLSFLFYCSLYSTEKIFTTLCCVLLHYNHKPQPLLYKFMLHISISGVLLVMLSITMCLV